MLAFGAMAAPHVLVDESRFPLVVVTFREVADDREFDAYLDRMSALVRRQKKNVVILDASEAGAAPASQRKKQADWITQNSELLRAHSLGTAFVISSPLVRGMLTAIFWLQPMPNPHAVVGTYAEAERWAIEQLARVGLTAPPAARFANLG